MKLKIFTLLCCFLFCVGSLFIIVSAVATTESGNNIEWDAATKSTTDEMSIILMIPSVLSTVKNAAKESLQ